MGTISNKHPMVIDRTTCQAYRPEFYYTLLAIMGLSVIFTTNYSIDHLLIQLGSGYKSKTLDHQIRIKAQALKQYRKNPRFLTLMWHVGKHPSCQGISAKQRYLASTIYSLILILYINKSKEIHYAYAKLVLMTLIQNDVIVPCWDFPQKLWCSLWPISSPDAGPEWRNCS